MVPMVGTWLKNALAVEMSVGRSCSARMVGVPEVEIATSRSVSFPFRRDASEGGQESIEFSQRPRTRHMGRIAGGKGIYRQQCR
jgi:hypothetical protein